MATQNEVTLPAMRRTRKSIGGDTSTRKTLDKENRTLDVGGAMAGSRKKSRSKSMGPGGLDALKKSNGNRRASLAVPPPRSILKPTIPLLPEIPSYKPKETPGSNGGGGETGGTKIALRTEEEQQAAVREREEHERARLEKEIKDRRDARRKSLANRRVSFAAEATLHTFHEVEEMQDSTTSTDSTRRAYSIAGQPSSVQQDQQPTAAQPSTPADHVDDHVAESPAKQRDFHQTKRRRSSAASSMYGSDDTVASSLYDSDLEHAEVQAIEMEDSSDDEDGTIMTVEAEEMTSASTASAGSPSAGDTTGSLDENLRLAARRAVTQSLDEDEEVIEGFAGWGRKNSSQENVSQSNTKEKNTSDEKADDQGSEMDMDMDMTSAVGGILYPQLPSPDKDDEVNEDMSMDVTTALGGILSKAKAFLRRKSINPSSQPAPSEFGDQTMDFTTAIGGIQQGGVFDTSNVDTDENEDMSMELTTAVGGLLSGLSKGDVQNKRRRTIAKEVEDDDSTMMDMIGPVGRILPTRAEEDDGDQTMGMDMTMAVGGIIKSASTPEARSAARKIMEQEADEPDYSMTTTAEQATAPKQPAALIADENASPGISAFQGAGLRRTPPRTESPAARSPGQSSSSPMRLTPSPKRTAMQARRGPTRTPPSVFGSHSSSPIRNLSSPVKTTPRSPARSKLFHQDPSTGLSTPRVVLTPQGRRLSGVGADRPGLGSPRVAEIFDRRESIGEAARPFVPTQPANPRRNVAFTDPREMEAEIDRERQDQHEREDSRLNMEREVNGSLDDREGSVNLREMIQGLSPKKNPLKGRKSILVGSALGLLGKRPAELGDDDESEESEESDGVKRLKGHQGSPVKNIRLQSPPSKAETTTGRKTRPSMRPAELLDADSVTPTVTSSPQRATTPKGQGRFRNADNDQPMATIDFDHAVPMDEAEAQFEDDGERIHLQDFLNMTSIRFMELTTTKRRHTVAPGTSRESTAAGGKDDLSFERCVVAGACTVPMLELYQHSCRELKKYISEGRRIVREIETETFEENPPLFREYMTASPDFKVLMDNQFKNVKTHARLLSKAMWYEWRMKLQDGLKEGLLKTAEGMDNDERLLEKQEELLSSILPDMVKRLKELEGEHVNLEALAQELADCDPQDLEDARAELTAVGDSIAEKARKLAELQRELEESVQDAETLAQQKQHYIEQIREADKVREECRGWSSDEVSKLKAQTDAVEKKHGWAIRSISGTTITMRYKREIELVFDLALPQRQQRQQQEQQQTRFVSLRYVAKTPSQCPPEKEFFLHHIRGHLLRSQQQTKASPSSSSSSTVTHHPKRLLGIVSSAWDRAGAVSEHIRRLSLCFPTAVVLRTGAQTPEEDVGAGTGTGAGVSVTASMLLAPLQTRVEVVLELGMERRGDDGGVDVVVSPEARVVYGESFNEGKMKEFLAGRVWGGNGGGNGGDERVGWVEAVLELYKRLLVKGRQRQ
ncbi:Spc7-domain-containing protein [Parathielavia appendiculata]|uniref:Spc7-domain-containing protein n=1 Tax=Parathielavia appendiculata TaxID=2587402 RepID=A0AAN6Z7S2_9PEZI|nr:Spc7-domain-containing protein [Parathielavia appendiculata]